MATVKIYPTLVRAVADGLDAFDSRNQPTEHYIRALGRKRQFGSRDRRFVGRQLYDIVRYRRWYDHILDRMGDARPGTVTGYILLNLLRSGTGIQNSDQFIEAEDLLRLEAALNGPDVPDAIRTSFPDWLWDRGAADHGEAWPSIADALNTIPPTYIRTNRIKTQAEQLRNRLEQDGCTLKDTELPDCLLVEDGKQLHQHKLYRQGHFEFQDMASQQVALAASLPDDAFVIDVCAGAGGKSLHFASLLRNRGRILAADKETHRLEQLRFRAERAGARNIETVGMVSLLDHRGEADVVLLDVPCSATGTIGRNPAAKWLFDASGLHELIETQQELITTYAPLVKRGGQLIYATCSILKAESEAVVAGFLQAADSFEMVREERFIPGQAPTDGFYFAVLHNKKD